MTFSYRRSWGKEPLTKQDHDTPAPADEPVPADGTGVTWEPVSQALAAQALRAGG